jgi:hypothetical protein
MTFTPEEIGTIHGSIDTASTAYYLGLGFGSSFDADSQWRVTLDVGVWISSGDPSIDLTATGTAANNPVFQAELEEEEADVEEDLINCWPALSVALSYRF